MKNLSFFMLIMMVVSTSAHSQTATCGKSVLSEKQLAAIIQKERTSNPELPKKAIQLDEDRVKIKVMRVERCYYHYSEEAPQTSLVTFLINKDGEVAIYQGAGFVPKAGCQLKRKTLTQDDLTDRLKKARELDASLPAEPKNREVRMHRFNCSYIYRESVDINTDNVFVFDSLGDIYDDYIDRNVRGLLPH